MTKYGKFIDNVDENIDNQYLNEEKDALEIFFLFQLRLPAFQESSTHIQMELTAEFLLKVCGPQKYL